MWKLANGVLTVILAAASLGAVYATSELARQSSRNDQLFVQIGQLTTSVEGLTASHQSLRADIGEMQRGITDLGIRLKESETDPAALLARAGIVTGKSLVGMFIQGRMFLFPTSKEAASKLETAGYVVEQITPFMQGYTAPAFQPPRQ